MNFPLSGNAAGIFTLICCSYFMVVIFWAISGKAKDQRSYHEKIAFRMIGGICFGILVLYLLSHFPQSKKQATEPTAGEIKTFAMQEARTLRALAISLENEGKRDSALIYRAQADGFEITAKFCNTRP